LTDYFRTNRMDEVFAPSLLGLNIPLLDNWVNQYISQKLTEKVQRNAENLNNPLVNRQDSVKRRLEKGIFEVIRNSRRLNRDSLKALNRHAAQIYNSVQQIQTD